MAALPHSSRAPGLGAVRVALLQCEIEHRHQAPHLPMCLFAHDLRSDGHDVRLILVHPDGLDEAAEDLRGKVGLCVLDSVFTFGLQRRLREALGVPIVVGGHNALQHAIRGPADAAIVGPGRAALRALVGALAEGRDALSAPGTWARDESGVLHCGPEPTRPDLRSELLPFRPVMDWEYFGPPRAPGSNLRVPSVVAGMGCPWNGSAVARPGPYEAVAPRLPEVPASAEARRRLSREFVAREGGCTFCVVRYARRTTSKRAETLDLLALQAAEMVRLGARGLSVQTEDPLPILVRLLDRLTHDGLASRLDELHVRTTPGLLLAHEGELGRAIERAGEIGLTLVLAQVGFETFDDPGLAVFHKGIDAATNRRAARLLGGLATEHRGFVATSGHGMVPLHPWSTPASLRATIDACRQDAPWLLPGVHPSARVEIYDEWSPLFWKTQDAGLLVPAPDRFGWDWRFADPEMGALVAAASRLAGGSGRLAGAGALDLALRVHEREPDPILRRQALLALRRDPVARGTG